MTELAAPHGRRRPIPTKAASAEPVAAALPTRILVVEDDFLISLEMESTLTAAGFEVVVVGSGEEALDSAAADRPDLVVMDIRLSGAMMEFKLPWSCFEFTVCGRFLRRRIPIPTSAPGQRQRSRWAGW